MTRPPTERGRAAVIGAGWAGLSAAVTLRDAGWEVSVFEASRTPGGRARRLSVSTAAHAPLDNGQHILIGAYRDTLALMQRLECDPERRFLRQPFTLASADGRQAIRAPRWPAPLHAVAALLGARGLRLRDRLAAVKLVSGLRRRAWRSHTLTVSELLAQSSQPPALVEQLWRPLCLAALNTPPDTACAQLFCNVLRDTLDAPRDASDLLLPRRDLSALWPDAAAALCDMRYGHTVRQLLPAADHVRIDGEPYDAAVIATPPRNTARLLAPLPGAASLVRQLEAYTYHPIATLTAGYDHPIPNLAAPMLMLREDPARGHHGQWVFDRTRLFKLDPGHPELSIVASVADDLAALPRQAAIQALLAQLQEQLHLPPPTHSELVIDKLATFAATPYLQRPASQTPWPRLALAGDWTDTGYPGVLEGAVRSGMQAARWLMRSRPEAHLTTARN